MIVSDQLAGLEPPRVTEEQRRRVLAAAYRAAGEPLPALVNRLWGNRRLRLAWAAAALVLAGAHVFISAPPVVTVRPVATLPAVVSPRGADSDLMAAARALPASGPRASDRRLLQQVLEGTTWDRS